MASTSPRRRRQRLICASRFNSINSAAGSICQACSVSEGLDRGLEVGILPRLRIKIQVSKNDIANKTKNMSSELHLCFITCCKLCDSELCNCGHGHDHGCKMADKNKMCIQNCGIRTSLVNFRRPKMVRCRRML